MSSILILPDWLIAAPPDLPLRQYGIRIEAGVITHLARNDELRASFPEAEIINAAGQLLAPGFVNAHTHLYGVLAHGIPMTNAPDGFWPFLRDFWWPRVEDRIDNEMLTSAAAWQCAQMLKSGVTSFYDCLEAPNTLPGCLELEAGAIEPFGQRAILSFEATGRMSPQNSVSGLRENASFILKRKQIGGLVQGLMCFHTTFTCDGGFIREAFRLANELDCRVHMHCSEGTYEAEQALKNYGMRPIEYYDWLGVAGARMIASQCVQLNEHEIQLIAERGIKVVHMPLSNCEVGGGIAPVPALIQAGVAAALGSDSYIDNFFEVMRGAFLLHKANQKDPRVMPAGLVWQMATLNGARVLGLEGVGCLLPGWQADLQLIDAECATPLTEENLYDQMLLYRNPEHIRLVMTAGEVLFKDGILAGVSQAELRQAVGRQAQRLWDLS